MLYTIVDMATGLFVNQRPLALGESKLGSRSEAVELPKAEAEDYARDLGRLLPETRLVVAPAHPMVGALQR